MPSLRPSESRNAGELQLQWKMRWLSPDCSSAISFPVFLSTTMRLGAKGAGVST